MTLSGFVNRKSSAVAGALCLAAAVFGAAFLVGRAATSGDGAGAERDVPELATPPSLTDTPEPGETPDPSVPGSFIPWLNRDRDLPKLQGELNGIRVGYAFHEDDYLMCDTGVEKLWGEEAEERVAGTPFEIPYEQLPEGVEPRTPLVVTLCDGGVLWLTQDFDYDPGDDLIAGFTILRMGGGVDRTGIIASEERWEAAELGGRPAITLRPVIDRIPNAAVVVKDHSIDGLTEIEGGGMLREELWRVAEALYQRSEFAGWHWVPPWQASFLGNWALSLTWVQ